MVSYDFAARGGRKEIGRANITGSVLYEARMINGCAELLRSQGIQTFNPVESTETLYGPVNEIRKGDRSEIVSSRLDSIEFILTVATIQIITPDACINESSLLEIRAAVAAGIPIYLLHPSSSMSSNPAFSRIATSGLSGVDADFKKLRATGELMYDLSEIPDETPASDCEASRDSSPCGATAPLSEQSAVEE